MMVLNLEVNIFQLQIIWKIVDIGQGNVVRKKRSSAYAEGVEKGIAVAFFWFIF